MKAIIRLKVLLAIFCVIPLFITAQPGRQKITSANKKAVKRYEKAMEYLQGRQSEKAEASLLKAVKADPYFIEAWMMLGEIYIDNNQSEQAIDALKKAVEISPDFFPYNFYNLANLELTVGSYQNAYENYLKFLEYGGMGERQRKIAFKNLKNCEFAIMALENPVPFDPINLGDSINSKDDEYLPAITVDEQTLIITRRRLKDTTAADVHSNLTEDFFIAVKMDGAWSKARIIGQPVNTPGNEGAQCISPDGKYIYFTACNRPDGVGSCDIYVSKKIGDKWTIPANLGMNVNSMYWDSQPGISSDGKTLYFTSNRPGGYGGSDIWMVTLNQIGQWGKPVNLRRPVNTEGNEMSPFIHPDGQTLYFSSNGHIGMGGMDLYFSRKSPDGRWDEPENLGYPINTMGDEMNLIVNARGNIAFYSSDRLGGKGKQDLYSFELYDKARPNPVTYMKGLVYDKETKKRLDAKFELIDLGSGDIIIESYSDPVLGGFLVSIPTDHNYALNVSKDGYLFYSENFTLKGEHPQLEPYLKDIPLQPVKVGESVVLKNIFFETAKYDLKDESRVELNKLFQFLNKNITVKIEISGHTDNVGGTEYNQQLSKNRAKAVYDFLIQNGADKDRLTFAGYGESRPVDTNDTEAGRANNRRTEFRITGQ